MLSLIAAVVLHAAPLATLKRFAIDAEHGDPKQLVYAALGAPDHIEIQRCVPDGPVDCVAWTYMANDNPDRGLVVVLQRHDGMWTIYSLTI